MKLCKLALLAAVACGISANDVTRVSANDINLVSCSEINCDCGEPVCGCEPVSCEPAGGCDNIACDPGCGAETACCDSGCDSAAGCGLFGGAAGGCGGELGDPFTLFGDLPAGITAGGWASIGYHSAALPLFNSRPNEVQLHQAWLYAEKALDTSNGFDFGGRIDYLYGTDGPDTQAFGIGNDHWDNGWDHGNDYGHAIPQLYGEVGYGDVSVKFGHFFTIIGWEVVAAPDNFFYSHAYTMYNSEPFTHTGALATYSPSDDVTFWGGYSLGWDSGFEDNGDAFLGGMSLGLTDKLAFIYTTVMGRFDDGDIGRVDADGNTGAGENGYMHSIIFDYAVTDKLQYIFQSDYLDTKESTGNATVRQTFGINQYLLYTLTDRVAVGGRFEWYNAEGVFDNEVDVYSLTSGINYRPCANVILRPELRGDWVGGNATGILEDNKDSQFTFGMDSIFLF